MRLGGFLLAHRRYERKGEDLAPFRRIVNYRGRFEAKLEGHGFLYQLTPPVPVEVLPGRIRSARIVPPTSQNQARIEQDLRESITRLGTQRDDVELRRHAETIIRNYDPCISCATHFLKLHIDREGERG